MKTNTDKSYQSKHDKSGRDKRARAYETSLSNLRKSGYRDRLHSKNFMHFFKNGIA